MDTQMHRRLKKNPNPELDRSLLQKIKYNPSKIMSHDTDRLIVTPNYFDTSNRTLLTTWQIATQSSINMKTKLEERNQSRMTDFFQDSSKTGRIIPVEDTYPTL